MSGRIEERLRGQKWSMTAGEAEALAALVQATRRLIENDQHIAFAVPPPGWHQTHRAMHEALKRVGLGGDVTMTISVPVLTTPSRVSVDLRPAGQVGQ